jgi:8-oxo-dGTP diphosphatase
MHVRNSARAILLNQKGQILLFKYHFKDLLNKEVLWVTPGGGLEDDEDFDAALKREVFEETGLELTSGGHWIGTRDVLIHGDDHDFISHERYFLIRVDDSAISLDHITESEKDCLLGYKWWDADEILKSDEEFRPKKIGELVKELQSGNIPDDPIKIE